LWEGRRLEGSRQDDGGLCGVDQLYDIYYRFLETDDEYFDYAPAKVPPQGRWRIYGINLPEPILLKVYQANAARELQLST
jgi:hypothetical protein